MKKRQIKLKDFRPDEEVLIVARHHWFVFFRDVVGIAVLFILPFFAVPVVSVFIVQGGIQIPGGIGFFFASLWSLILWNMLFARWTDYYYDIWIITNWRIVDIDQKGLFHRDVATILNLDKIEDISTHVSSVIGTFLNYGGIQVQTAAASREFLFKDAAHPRKIEKVIRDAQEARLGIKTRA